MKRRNVLFAIIALLMLSILGCQKDEVKESGPAILDVKLLALNESFSLPVSAIKSSIAETPALNWNVVNMVVSEVKMEAEVKSLISYEDSIEIEYKWNGPQEIDLLDENISFGNFLLQPGLYDEIELKVKGEKEDAPSGPVFYMSGTYINSEGGDVPVVLEVFSNLEFKTEKESVEIIENNIEIVSYIHVYLDKLFAGVTPGQMDNAELTDGVLIISAQSNSNIYNKVLGKLIEDHHSEYWHDDDKYDHHNDDD